MNINNFKKFFSNYTILNRGFNYYNKNKVLSLDIANGNVTALVRGTHIYTVTMKLSADGTVSNIYCDCPYGDVLCKHTAAVLYRLHNEYGNQMDFSSSSDVKRLISAYNSISEYTVLQAAGEGDIRIVPEIRTNTGRFLYTLKIGRDKMYVIKDIDRLVDAFKYRENVRYGKELEFVHSYGILDKRSRALIELSQLICRTEHFTYNRKREFELTRSSIDSFFDLFRDDYVMCNGKMCLVKYENPKLTFLLQPSSNNRFMLTAGKDYIYLGRGRRACFILTAERKTKLSQDLNSHMTIRYSPFHIHLRKIPSATIVPRL